MTFVWSSSIALCLFQHINYSKKSYYTLVVCVTHTKNTHSNSIILGSFVDLLSQPMDSTSVPIILSSTRMKLGLHILGLHCRNVNPIIEAHCKIIKGKK